MITWEVELTWDEPAHERVLSRQAGSSLSAVPPPFAVAPLKLPSFVSSLCFAIGGQDPISQFFVRNPKELFHKQPEAAVLDSTNELVRETETGYRSRL